MDNQMESQRQPQDERLFELMLQATRIAFEYAKHAEAAQKYIGSHLNFPTIKYADNGLPSFQKIMISEVKDYSNVFTKAYPEIKYLDLPEFQALFSYIRVHETLYQYFMPTREWGKAFEIFISRVPLQMLDRYIRTYKNQEFLAENFLEIYLPIEAGLLNTQLDVFIAVPILLVNVSSG